MASLMGAEFSKSFDALKDTHLICYKFEGEKYKVAKRENTAKRANVSLVNHQWLEDWYVHLINYLKIKMLPKHHCYF
jgi:topoisomerase (DNA) II binding protein 1